MGWGKLETLIEKRREQTASDPRRTLRNLETDLLRPDLKPRDRARLHGLRAVCFRHLKAWASAQAAIAEARAVPKAGKLARVEISLQEATLHLYQALAGDLPWKIAKESAYDLIQQTFELRPRQPRTCWGRRQDRKRRGLQLTALVLAGQLALHRGDPQTAILLGFDALRLLPSPPKAGPTPQFLKRILSGPTSLIATALVRGAAAPAVAAELIGQICRNLPDADRLNRATLGAVLACLMSQAGQRQEADATFQASLRTLAGIGANSSYEQVLSMWVWCLKHVQKCPDRAAWVARSFADPANAPT